MSESRIVEDDLGAELVRCLVRAREELDELVLELREAVAPELPWIEVDFQVEFRELGRVVRVVEILQQLHPQHRRPQPVVDQTQLLLGPDPRDPALEPAVGQHLLQRFQVVDEMPHVRAALARVADAELRVTWHGPPPCRTRRRTGNPRWRCARPSLP
jgi:hypothetical protein